MNDKSNHYLCGMKISQTKNRMTDAGIPYVVIELGDILFYGGTTYLEVTHFENERPMSNEIDLIEYDSKAKFKPIVFEK